MRALNRRSCSLFPTSSQSLMRMIPLSIICFSKRRRHLEEPFVLFVGAESHHALHTGTVVPAPVEDDDLAGGGKVLHVPLHVHLGLLAVGRRGQRHETEDARARALRDGLDRPALPRGVAAFEDDDDAKPFLFHPILQHAQLGLQAGQLFFELLPLHLLLLLVPSASPCPVTVAAASRRRAPDRARRGPAARPHGSARAATAARTAPDRRSRISM